MAGVQGLELCNPFPELYKDNPADSTFYDSVKAIPYRGNRLNSSHMYLKVLYDLFELSSSFGAVINELVSTGFEGDLNLFKGGKIGLKTDPIELTDDEKLSFCDTIENFGFDISSIINCNKKEIRHYKICGNSYLHIRIVNVGESTKVNHSVLDPRCVMVTESKKSVIISSVFAERMTGFTRKTNKKDFKVVPIYPEVRRTQNITETVFHLKHEDGQSEVYGMPESIQSAYWQFIEYSLAKLSAKVSAHEFVTKTIMQLPSINPAMLKSGNDVVRKMLTDFKKTIQDLMTNSGENASSIAVLNMPLASEGEFKLHKLDVNRDTDWFKCQIETARSKIYELNRTYGQLTGARDAKSSLGQDTILALDSRYYSKTVRPKQSMMANRWMNVFNFISNETNSPELKDIRLGFPDRSKEIRDELEASKSTVNEARSNSVGESE